MTKMDIKDINNAFELILTSLSDKEKSVIEKRVGMY